MPVFFQKTGFALLLDNYVSYFTVWRGGLVSVEICLCISSKRSLVFKEFITGGDARQGNFLCASWVANLPFSGRSWWFPGLRVRKHLVLRSCILLLPTLLLLWHIAHKSWLLKRISPLWGLITDCMRICHWAEWAGVSVLPACKTCHNYAVILWGSVREGFMAVWIFFLVLSRWGGFSLLVLLIFFFAMFILESSAEVQVKKAPGFFSRFILISIL